MRFWSAAFLLAASLALGAGCARETGRLTPEQTRRIQSEGILHRADNLKFFRSREGSYGATRSEGVASIIVTRQSVLIHRNEQVFLEINPRSRRFLQVRREADRIRIRSGSGSAYQVWSFEAPDSAEEWAKDIRAVIGEGGTGRRSR